MGNFRHFNPIKFRQVCEIVNFKELVWFAKIRANIQVVLENCEINPENLSLAGKFLKVLVGNDVEIILMFEKIQ